MLVALGAAAWGGARYQASFAAVATSPQSATASVLPASEPDPAHSRERYNQLASRLGELQARLIELDGQVQRVLQAAGVVHTEPEIHSSLEQIMGEVQSAAAPDDLDRQLDSLATELEAQGDSLAVLDLLLTRRAGLDASIPDYRPVDYPYLTSSFGWRRNPVTGRHAMHEGLDFAAPRGTPIYAASAGLVTYARYHGSYGRMVEIAHGNGLSTRYAHASALKVKEGDLVDRGQLIALVGSTGRSTGSHLHYEVRMAGHALDPVLFLPVDDAPASLVAAAVDDDGAQASKLR